jgi:hypothetical protein
MFRKMTEITFHDWILECDVDATRETYQKVHKEVQKFATVFTAKTF